MILFLSALLIKSFAFPFIPLGLRFCGNVARDFPYEFEVGSVLSRRIITITKINFKNSHKSTLISNMQKRKKNTDRIIRLQ